MTKQGSDKIKLTFSVNLISKFFHKIHSRSIGMDLNSTLLKMQYFFYNFFFSYPIGCFSKND